MSGEHFRKSEAGGMRLEISGKNKVNDHDANEIGLKQQQRKQTNTRNK